MFLGPVFSLEMVTSARRTRYFWIRTLYAVCLFGAMLLNWLPYAIDPSFRRASASNFAGEFFKTFSFMQLTAILLLTPGMVAGTMALEHERRTIEYLLTSRLGNVEIVLGKLGARLFQVMALVLVGMPILSIATTRGGIEIEALLMMFLFSLLTLLAVASLSMAISVWAFRARYAFIKAYVLVLIFFVVPPSLWGLIAAVGGDPFAWYSLPFECMTLLNPYVVLFALVIMPGKFPIQAYAEAWSALAITTASYGVFSLACVTLAAMSVRRAFLKSTVGGSQKSVKTRRRWFQPKLGNQPMIWKEIATEKGLSKWGALARIAILLLAVALTWPVASSFIYVFIDRPNGYSYSERDSGLLGTSMFFGTVWQCFVLLLLAGRAACMVASEKERDCWTSLISTDLTPTEILWGKTIGNLYAGRWLFAIPIMFWLMEAVVRPDFLLVVPAMTGVWLGMALVVTIAGTWCSLWCSSSLRAMGVMLPALVFIGGGYMFCCSFAFFIVAAAMRFSGGGGEEQLFFMTLAPCIPYLLLGPELGWLALRQTQSPPHDPTVMMTIAWLVGVMGYTIAAVVMWSISRNQFDRLAGRTSISQPRVGAVDRGTA